MCGGLSQRYQKQLFPFPMAAMDKVKGWNEEESGVVPRCVPVDLHQKLHYVMGAGVTHLRIYSQKLEISWRV